MRERREDMADIKFKITKHIGAIGDGSKGWAKELNMVSWNDRPEKFDIREWSPDHEKMGKGVTLNADEAKALARLLSKEVGE